MARSLGLPRLLLCFEAFLFFLCAPLFVLFLQAASVRGAWCKQCGTKQYLSLALLRWCLVWIFHCSPETGGLPDWNGGVPLALRPLSGLDWLRTIPCGFGLFLCGWKVRSDIQSS